MPKRKRTANALAAPALALATWALMGAGTRQLEDRVCKHVNISIDSQEENYFLDVSAIKKLIGAEEKLRGARIGQIGLDELERKIMATRYAEETQVFVGAECTLNVYIKLKKPVARIVNVDGTGFYLDAKREPMPLSGHFSARTLPVRGMFSERVDSLGRAADSSLVALFPMLEYIHQRAFWKAQIAEIVTLPDGDLILFPQIGRTPIHFGTVENFPEKFERLQQFYQKIVSGLGWNYYRSISVKFGNQVVGEKR
jgi:cell division protein FtsQ